MNFLPAIKHLGRAKSRRKSALLIAAMVILGLYLGYRAYEGKRHAATLRQETLEMATPTVSIVSPQPVPQEETVTLPGTLVGWHQAPIYARVSGYVKEWYKDYGAAVKQGDLLAELNTPTLDAEYRQAKAEVEAQRAKYQLALVTARRYENLRSSNAVSVQSITVKQADVKVEKGKLNQALQNLKNIEARLGFKKIVAPFDGVVIERNVNVGDFVNEQGSLSLKGIKEANMFTVADIHKLRLFVSVPEAFGPFLQPGLTADVTVPQFPGRHFTARFLTVSNGFDVETRTAVVEFVIDNEDGMLWPGSYATVRLTAPVDRDSLTIPSTALVFQEKGTSVAVVTEDNRIHFKPITVRKILDTAFEVAGISKTDRIVDNPSAALIEGDQVRIVTPAPGYAAARGYLVESAQAPAPGKPTATQHADPQ